MNDSPWMFSARMTYDGSGRSFSMDLNKEYSVEIESSGWYPFGGPAVGIYANDDTRSVQVAFGLEKFVSTFATAIERFCNLEIDDPRSGETAEEQLEERNAFLRKAIERYPRILMELARTLHRLTDLAEEASVRISSMRKPS